MEEEERDGSEWALVALDEWSESLLAVQLAKMAESSRKILDGTTAFVDRIGAGRC